MKCRDLKVGQTINGVTITRIEKYPEDHIHKGDGWRSIYYNGPASPEIAHLDDNVRGT